MNDVCQERPNRLIRLLFVVGLVHWAAGCATATGRHQVVGIDSEPRGAEVYLKGRSEPIGTTPFFYKMSRVPVDTLVFKPPVGPTYSYQFKCQYRWWLEGLGNGSLMIFSPEASLVAFGLDYITGAAFECPLNLSARLPLGKDAPFRTTYCRKYLVVPPFHFDEKISDEIAEIWMKQALLGLKGCDDFYDFEKGKVAFQHLNLSHRNRVALKNMKQEQVNYVGLATGATDLVILSFEQNDHHLNINPQVIDLYTGETHVVPQFAVTIDNAKQFELSENERYLLYTFRFIPNSVSYGFSQTSQLITARSSQEITSIEEKKSLPSYLANWNMLSVEHPDAYSGWDFGFDFYPSFAFVYKEQKVKMRRQTELAEIEEIREHKLLHILPLYNASVTAHTAIGAFTISAGAGLSQHYLKAKGKNSFFALNAALMDELSYTAFFTQDMFFRLATGEYRFTGHQYEDEFYKIEPTVNFVSAGVGYFIPGFRRFARSFY